MRGINTKKYLDNKQGNIVRKVKQFMLQQKVNMASVQLLVNFIVSVLPAFYV